VGRFCSSFVVDIATPAWLSSGLGGNFMSDRHQTLDDHEFWTRLEHDASYRLEVLNDKTFRRSWVDGSLRFSFLQRRRT
jgi:hypothetical protein